MNEQFLKKIKASRKAKDLTQEDVAKYLGITRRAYLSFENGESNFRKGKNDPKYKKLCELLEIEKLNYEEEERIIAIETIRHDIQIMRRMLQHLENQLVLLEEV